MDKFLKILENIKLLKKVETYRNDKLCYIVDFGKYKGSYIDIFKFDNGIMKKEYVISYGMVEENKKLIFEVRNIATESVNEAKNILIKAINQLKLS